ncbi:MAG: hypothetical protein ACSW8J_08155, partial [bacterium]
MSGSVAGKDSAVSLGGAVSVLVSNGASEVTVYGGEPNKSPKDGEEVENNHRIIQGSNVTVEAIDKSRLTARAGGISLSRGSSVGMGIASTNIISNNTVTAEVGDFVDITAGSFKLNAEKRAVTDADFKNLVNWKTLVTDSSQLSDAERETADTGLIDFHKGEGENNYKVEVHLSSDKMLGLLDGLNFLSGRNTYAEAIAGSIGTGSADINLAGSFAVAVTQNRVNALLGHDATVTLKKSDSADGSMTVNADNGTMTRVIAGSLSAAPAKTSVGATVAVLVAGDIVTASTAEKAKIDAEGDFSHKASTGGDIQLFTGAMAVAADSLGANAVGGAINVIVDNNVTNNTIGADANITSGGDADIASKSALDMTVISGSANVAASTARAVAAGGTVNVIVDKTEANTKLNSNAIITGAKNLSVTSDVSDHLISGTASLSVATSLSGGTGAGVVNVIVSKSVASTNVGMAARLKATNEDLKITANNDASMINAGAALAGSGGISVGGAFNINVFNRSATVNIADGTLETEPGAEETLYNLQAGRNLITRAGGRDTNIMAGLTLAAGATGAAISGNVIVGVMNSKVQNIISGKLTGSAGGSAIMEAYYSGFDVGAAGNVAVSGTSPAVGATVVTVVRNNDVRTQLSGSEITTRGDDAIKSLTG